MSPRGRDYGGDPHECQVIATKDPTGSFIPKQQERRSGTKQTATQWTDSAMRIYVDGSSTIENGTRITGCGIYVEDQQGQPLIELALKLPSHLSAQAAKLATATYRT